MHASPNNNPLHVSKEAGQGEIIWQKSEFDFFLIRECEAVMFTIETAGLILCDWGHKQ